MPTLTEAIAGPFKALFTPKGGTPSGADDTLGAIGPRGIRVVRRYAQEQVSADVLGESVLDTVYLGGDIFIEFELEEANRKAVLSMMNPFRGGTISSHITEEAFNEVGVPGVFGSDRGGSLILRPLYAGTAALHTTAASRPTNPTMNFGLVIPAPGFEMERLFASRRRIIPVRLQCLPYSDGGSPPKYVWYTKTAAPTTYEIV